jgi:hypothetical protein
LAGSLTGWGYLFKIIVLSNFSSGFFKRSGAIISGFVAGLGATLLVLTPVSKGGINLNFYQTPFEHFFGSHEYQNNQ